MEQMYFPFELFAALFVYAVRIERRKKFGVYLGCAVLINGLGLCLWGVLGNMVSGQVKESSAMIMAGTVISCGFIFAALVLLILLPCKVSLQEAVYCVCCAYLSEHMAYCVRLLLNGVTKSHIADAGTLCYFLIHIGIYLASYFLYAKKLAPKNHYTTSAVQSWGLLIVVLSLVLVMSVIATAFHFEMLHGIYALFSCMIVLYSQLKAQTQFRIQEELNIQRQLWMRHKAQYEMAKETIDLINGKCHDLKHQVAALRTIDNLEKRSGVIDSIEDSVMIYDSMFQTGNTILDTVLTEKSLLCKKKKIGITCIADGTLLDFMDAVDLYTLFGNALDNAMEAVQKLPEEERFLSLLLHKKAGLIFIQVENRYQGKIMVKDGFPVTTKEDKNYHGFGIPSIYRIAEKYHGFVTIETEYQIFLLRMTIPTAVGD